MRLTIFVSIVVVTTFISIRLFTDEALNPKAAVLIQKSQAQQESQEKAPELENNAFMQLIALHYAGDDAYQQATTFYAQHTKDQQNEFILGKQPSLNKFLESSVYLPTLKQIREPLKYCSQLIRSCMEHINQNKQFVTKVLNLINNTLTSYLAISDYENFDYIEFSWSYHGGFDREIQDAVILQIYYLIEDNQLVLAADSLFKLIKLNRKFIESAPMSSPAFNAYGHFSTSYPTLIRMLILKGFNDWSRFDPYLKPLPISIVTSQSHFEELFKDMVMPLVKFNEEAIDKTTHFALSKPNATINRVYELMEQFKINENATKAELIGEFARINKLEKEVNKRLEGSELILFQLANFDNMLGVTFALQAAQKAFGYQGDELIDTDLVILLTAMLIESQRYSIEQVILKPKFKNPYTSKQAFIKDGQLCFNNSKKDVCIKALE